MMDERAKEIKEESPIWSNFLSKRARINSVVGPVPRILALLTLAVEEIYSLTWYNSILFGDMPALRGWTMFTYKVTL